MSGVLFKLLVPAALAFAAGRLDDGAWSVGDASWRGVERTIVVRFVGDGSPLAARARPDASRRAVVVSNLHRARPPAHAPRETGARPRLGAHALDLYAR